MCATKSNSGKTLEDSRVSFAANIRPLFRDKDINAMGSRFDLSSCEDVRANAERIHGAVASGYMPCDGAWSDDRIALFKRWMNEGMHP